jgi:hypothetical protein
MVAPYQLKRFKQYFIVVCATWLIFVYDLDYYICFSKSKAQKRKKVENKVDKM